MPNGWLMKLGVLDHAGGNVVHLTGGTTALVFSLFMKKRRGSFTVFVWLKFTILEYIDKWRKSRNPPPKTPKFEDMMMGKGSSLRIETPWRPKPLTKHSLPFVVLGTGLLWLGWFGFNGSAFGAANLGAVISVVNTHLSIVMGACTYLIVDFILTGKPRIMAGCLGAIIGMVMSTPAAGFIHPGYSILMSFIGATLTPFFILLKSVMVDDTLDAAGIHMFSGFLASILTGVFASKSILAYGSSIPIRGGWVDGNWVQVPIQILASVTTFAYTFVVTSLLFLVFLLLGWNVSNYEERVGLDYSQHGEVSYIYEPPEDHNPSENETLPMTHIDYLNVLKEKIRYWWVHRGQVSDNTFTTQQIDPVSLKNPHHLPSGSMERLHTFGSESPEVVN
jgi:Amt family ammonium transporter